VNGSVCDFIVKFYIPVMSLFPLFLILVYYALLTYFSAILAEDSVCFRILWNY